MLSCFLGLYTLAVGADVHLPSGNPLPPRRRSILYTEIGEKAPDSVYLRSLPSGGSCFMELHEASPYPSSSRGGGGSLSTSPKTIAYKR